MASKYTLGIATTLLSILCFTCLAKESSTEQPQNVVVKGKVFCDTCGEGQLADTNARVIVGAVVAVECNMKRKLKMGSTSVEGKTGENGEFSVELSPSAVHSRCGVRLVSSPEESCNVPSIATASDITLASNSNGVLSYNSPPLAFRPSSSCQHSDAESKQILLPPMPLQTPPLPFSFPPLPRAPPLPNLPSSPLPFSPLPSSAPFPPLAIPTSPFSVPFPPLAIPTPPFSVPFPPLAISTPPSAPPTK